jgi:hypothetical protein
MPGQKQASKTSFFEKKEAKKLLVRLRAVVKRARVRPSLLRAGSI